MGRGRSGITNQSDKKMNKTHMANDKNNYAWLSGITTNKPSTVAFPEEFLKALGQMNPRDFVNIIVN